MQQYRKNLGKVSLTAEGIHDSKNKYEVLSIVYDEHTQHGFISRQNVPEGVDLYNKEYWMPLNVSGYVDSNIIILSKKTSESDIQSYTLEEAINSIAPVGRKPGAILGFYNKNSDRLDIGGCWEIWQFNSTTISEWEDVSHWQNIYYNYNKFVGWYKNEQFLKKHNPFPEVGCYAYVGNMLNEAVVYRCEHKYVWNETTQHAWDYVKVMIDGTVTVGENGNWFNNGIDTGIPVNVKGDPGLTPFIRYNTNINKLEYSYDKLKWIICSDYISSWFRWQSEGGEQNNSIGKIQISRDNIIWTNLSGEFVNNLRISKYIGADESLPIKNIAEGTIYAKGPYYEDEDTLQEYPTYRIWVYAWKDNTLAWIDNGSFTSIVAGIVQETGDSETAVMSQKAVTEKLSELGSKIINHKLQTTGVGYESTRIIDIVSDLFIAGNKVNIVLKSNESESVNIGVIGYVDDETSENLGNIYYKNRVYTYELTKSYIKIRLYNNVSANKYVVDVDVSSIKRSIEDLEKKIDEEVGSLQSSVKDINSELNVVNVTTSSRISEYISNRLTQDTRVIFNITDTLSASCNITIFGYYSDSEYDTLGVIYNKNVPKSVVLGKDYKKIRLYNNAGSETFTYTMDIEAVRPIIESHNDTLYGLTEKTNSLSLDVGTAQTFFKSMNLKANTKIFLSVNSEDGAIGSNAVFGYKKSNNTNVNEIAYAPLNKEVPYILPEDCVGIIGYIANVTSEGNFAMEVKVEGLVDSIASLRDSAVFPYSAKIFKKIGGIGDSYMSGHIHLNGQEASVKNYDYSWGHYFSKLTGEIFENYAQSGSTAKQWVNTTLFDRVKSCQAYMIALMINDQGDWSNYSTPVGTIDDIGTDADTYYAYYYKLIQKVVAVNPNAKIFCFTCFVYSDSFAYNVAVRDIVDYCKNQGQNVYLVDTAKYKNKQYFENPVFVKDRVNGHYTSIGYEFMAECHYKLVSDVINNNVYDFQNVFQIPFELNTDF